MKRDKKFVDKRPLESDRQTLSKISINLGHLVSNKKYNLEHDFGDTKKKRNAMAGLLELLQIMSKRTNADLGQYVNIEQVAVGRLKSKNGKRPRDILESSGMITDDKSKVSIIRFNSNANRAIFRPKADDGNIYCLIALDFDYSLYDHG